MENLAAWTRSGLSAASDCQHSISPAPATAISASPTHWGKKELA